MVKPMYEDASKLHMSRDAPRTWLSMIIGPSSSCRMFYLLRGGKMVEV